MPYMVVMTEYERGWGSKDFLAIKFERFDDAKAKMAEVNAKNTAPTAPDYYIQARVITNPDEFKHYEDLL